MGRARGVTLSAEDPTGSRRRRGLSLIQGGAEPSAWTVTSLERLTRALDLRPIGFRRYEAIAAEARWPAFPGAQLVASAVVAAERSLPGVSVGHLSCSFGPLPRADRPVEVAMSEVHIGESCITGRLTFRQRSAVHGEATVLLRPCASQVATDQLARSLGRVSAADPLQAGGYAPAGSIGGIERLAPPYRCDRGVGSAWRVCDWRDPPDRRLPDVVARSRRYAGRHATASASCLFQ